MVKYNRQRSSASCMLSDLHKMFRYIEHGDAVTLEDAMVHIGITGWDELYERIGMARDGEQSTFNLQPPPLSGNSRYDRYSSGSQEIILSNLHFNETQVGIDDSDSDSDSGVLIIDDSDIVVQTLEEIQDETVESTPESTASFSGACKAFLARCFKQEASDQDS